MIKTIIFAIFLIWCNQSKANILSDQHIVNDNRITSLTEETDSSNYKIKILRNELYYSQIRFTIVDERNNPLNAVIQLNNVNQKGLSGILANKNGKVFIMVYDDAVKTIEVGRIGFGRVTIPIEEVKNKVTEIRVQLYAFGTEN